VDNDRGYFKAPANEVVSGITKIAQDITKREQDLLNPYGINALRFFPDRGNRVWGARTLSSDSSWKYINVRRIFIFVEASIDKGTQWVVFEPNDEPLWARVRQTIGNFLNTVWRSGALQGAKPDEAYFVKCDHTTMTQDDIDNGKLICVIGIAPVKPAEFVIFRIQQKTLDTKTS
jgi:phage tail sheath protein FI